MAFDGSPTAAEGDVVAGVAGAPGADDDVEVDLAAGRVVVAAGVEHRAVNAAFGQLRPSPLDGGVAALARELAYLAVAAEREGHGRASSQSRGALATQLHCRPKDQHRPGLCEFRPVDRHARSTGKKIANVDKQACRAFAVLDTATVERYVRPANMDESPQPLPQ